MAYNSEGKAFMYEYLELLMDVTKLVFIMLNDIPDINTVKAINAYYKTSDVRLKMDKGNWMALNKGSKQILHSINLDNCYEKNPQKIDGIMLYWLANIYTKWQWNYPELTSKDINEKCFVITLMKLYYLLHEASDEKTIEILNNKYFGFNREREINYEENR